MAQNKNHITNFLRLIDVLDAENVSPYTANFLKKKYRYCVGLADQSEFYECLFHYGIVMNLMLNQEFQTVAAVLEQFQNVKHLVENFDFKFSKCIKHLKISPNSDFKDKRILDKAQRYYPLVKQMFRAYALEVLKQNKEEGVLQEFRLQSDRLQNMKNIFSAKNQKEFQNLFKLFPQIICPNFYALQYYEETKTHGILQKVDKKSVRVQKLQRLSCSMLIIGPRYFLLYSKPSSFSIEPADYSTFSDQIILKLPQLNHFFIEEEKKDPFDRMQISVRPTRQDSGPPQYQKVAKDIEGIYEQLQLLNQKIDRKSESNQEVKKLHQRIEELEVQLSQQQETIKSQEEEKTSLIKLSIGMAVEFLKVVHKRVPPSSLVKHFKSLAKLLQGEEELVEFINNNLINRINNSQKVIHSEYNGSHSNQNSFESAQIKIFQEDDLDQIRKQKAAASKLKEEQKNKKLALLFQSKESEYNRKQVSSLSQNENESALMKRQIQDSSSPSESEEQCQLNKDSLELREKKDKKKNEIKKENKKNKNKLQDDEDDSLEEENKKSEDDDIKRSKIQKPKKKRQIIDSNDSFQSREDSLKPVKPAQKQKPRKKILSDSHSDSDDSLQNGN